MHVFNRYKAEDTFCKMYIYLYILINSATKIWALKLFIVNFIHICHFSFPLSNFYFPLLYLNFFFIFFSPFYLCYFIFPSFPLLYFFLNLKLNCKIGHFIILYHLKLPWKPLMKSGVMRNDKLGKINSITYTQKKIYKV